MSISGLDKIAARTAGTLVTDVSRASEVAQEAVRAAKDTNGDKKLDLSDLLDALEGKSSTMKAAALAAYNSAKKAAGGTPKRSEVSKKLDDATQTLVKADADGDLALDKAEIESLTSATAVRLVEMAAAMSQPKEGKQSVASLKKSLEAVVAGVMITSESESPVWVVSAKAGTEMTVEGVLEGFAKEWAKLNYVSAPDEDPIEVTAEIESKSESKKSLEGMGDTEGEEDPTSYYYVAGTAFQRVKALFDDNLTDVRYVKFGPKAEDGSMGVDQGEYLSMFVGRTDDGRLVGVAYTLVHT